ncbi:hypothetical protein skT53_24350 [Effusibacillus dendaii]|uniref:Uncharacterized protein n=2 Tax=Effusibacillus dendaii TaxID=2743772 RepID=A0A7I8DFV6_9BACL|nr:hypothetical protein skT53_24350 [Effusibacillus dendaii]
MREEFLAHLEDATEEYVSMGYLREQSMEMAIKDFGDANMLRKEVVFMLKNRLRNVQLLVWLFLALTVVSFALTGVLSLDIRELDPFHTAEAWDTLKSIFFSSLLLTLATWIWSRRMKQRITQ